MDPSYQLRQELFTLLCQMDHLPVKSHSSRGKAKCQDVHLGGVDQQPDLVLSLPLVQLSHHQVLSHISLFSLRQFSQNATALKHNI